MNPEIEFCYNFIKENPGLSYDDIVKAFQESQSKGKEIDKDLLPESHIKEMEIVRRAFDREFQNPNDLLERFLNYIDKCSHEYHLYNTIYYAPYVTLTQASGTGKSKLLKKVAENVTTIYCCLRDYNSNGYPFRSFITNVLLKVKFEFSVLPPKK
ncbi:27252_t:CDS:2 [Dentiscutata erythropus]|uniref:27252_t:CDS:1 n=1 Tax=Dentiscutata erythropus TaxID=1348616 RepID=A0A9N9NLR4_9GLOM|nr:27252_t:CDS:2 [Dentiscutata erythropus]